MKNLYLILVLSALVACTGSSQKEKPACVNTPVEPFTGLPVFDLQEQYPEKEIILQDIADVRYVVLETGDSSLVGIRPILMTDSFLVTVNKKSDVIFFDKSGKYLHSFNHTGMSGEEYGDIVSGYCIDEKAREIFIYDGLQSRIQVYGYGGAYRRTLKLPQNRMFASSIFEYDENFLFGEDYRLVDSQIGKYPVNKTPYYKERREINVDSHHGQGENKGWTVLYSRRRCVWLCKFINVSRSPFWFGYSDCRLFIGYGVCIS